MGYTTMNYQLHQGDSAQVLKQYPDNHFDSIVCDPPYGISFLGKSWDANTGSLEIYQECIRVLKPGGHILAFSAARTYHHLAITLEQAGFEIRDQIMWIYGSGFPKSQDVGRNIQRSLGVKETKEQKGYNGFGSENGTAFTQDWDRGPEKNPEVVCTDPEAKQWAGWGTQLKPAHEPIVLARKPMTQTIAKNCQEWGTGAINIDACRVPYESEDEKERFLDYNKYAGNAYGKESIYEIKTMQGTHSEIGRFPSNVIGEIDEPYQKYFYCPKVSRKERHLGHDDPGALFSGPRFDVYMPTAGKTDPNKSVTAVEAKSISNNHPTVKPIELMKYLIKLVTPKGGKVLDPFNGSGSTGCAAVSLGHHYTGIDLDQHYIDISHKRIQAYNTSTYNDLFEEDE